MFDICWVCLLKAIGHTEPRNMSRTSWRTNLLLMFLGLVWLVFIQKPTGHSDMYFRGPSGYIIGVASRTRAIAVHMLIIYVFILIYTYDHCCQKRDNTPNQETWAMFFCKTNHFLQRTITDRDGREKHNTPNQETWAMCFAKSNNSNMRSVIAVAFVTRLSTIGYSCITEQERPGPRSMRASMLIQYTTQNIGPLILRIWICDVRPLPPVES